MNVGINIKKHRKRLKLTQKQLASKLGKVESAIRMWELGKSDPTLSSLLIMKDLFGVSLDELVE